eukprot:jgi/Mesvir1/21972/Mv08637-RA.1
MAAGAAGTAVVGASCIWFRKGMRLHDNPALLRAIEGARHVYPIYILDPFFLKPDPNARVSPGSCRAGVIRIKFLLQSLEDLHRQLEARGSRLLLVHGTPATVFPHLLSAWKIERLCFERDTEPYALARDRSVKELAAAAGVAEVFDPVSHTLYDPDHLISCATNRRAPLTYQAFLKLVDRVGRPPRPAAAPARVPPPAPGAEEALAAAGARVVPVPSLEDLGHPGDVEVLFPGGESAALARFERCMADEKWVVAFDKPKTDPTALTPSTTVLSPYMKFGCLSARTFYWRLHDIEARAKGGGTQPPVSLLGQLYWREFFYTVGYDTPNFEHMEGNPICRQIPWDNDPELMAAWNEGRTGYPWIDAVMAQLRTQGWIHHLARHSVACFLTRGDLFQYWVPGRKVFERLLLDHDWFMNIGNWLWLSASAFFSQYFRVYSPVAFPKKYDPSGKYVRHFLPALKDMPKEYIYEPWKAPLEVQRRANCIVGKDYPFPVVDHAEASKRCISRMAAAYKASKGAGGQQDDNDDDGDDAVARGGAGGSTGADTGKQEHVGKKAKPMGADASGGAGAGKQEHVGKKAKPMGADASGEGRGKKPSKGTRSIKEFFPKKG